MHIRPSLEKPTVPLADNATGTGFSPTVVLVLCLLLFNIGYVSASESAVPEPFLGFDDSSNHTIDYDVLTQWLKSVVVDIGRSDRKSAAFPHARTGTRIRPVINRKTIYEGNRFFFEEFEDNDEAKQVLVTIKNSLEQIPDAIPLEVYSRNEQLAYWLNLYNITLLNELVAIYPKRNLKELLVGDQSILDRKLLTVAGIPLSLNDIQFTILRQNYDSNPLIFYGLYQGVIGGPSIRRSAYTGEDVYRALTNNAIEFVNSNRGTGRRVNKDNVLRVSVLYEINRAFFSDLNADLAGHLLDYLDSSAQGKIDDETILKPSIYDWTITDLFGTYPEIYIGASNNPAALLGAIVSPMGSLASGGSSRYLAKIYRKTQYSPEVLKHLLVINTMRIETNEKNAIVTMEELGEVPVSSGEVSTEEQ